LGDSVDAAEAVEEVVVVAVVAVAAVLAVDGGYGIVSARSVEASYSYPNRSVDMALAGVCALEK
jgi:hypothetical protein